MRRATSLLLVAVLFPTLLQAQKSERQQIVDRLAKDLKSRDVATRVEAVENLGKLKIPEGIEPLVMALSDKDASVREEAARQLWNMNEIAQAAIPALRRALEDPAPAVVARAAGALIAMDVSPAEIADPLRLVLQKGDTWDRFLAARALIPVESGDKLVGPIIEYLKANASNADNFRIGSKALETLAERQDPSIVPILLARLRDTSQLALPIVSALGKINPRPDGWIDVLVGQLGSSNAEVRELAVELLGKQKSIGKEVKVWAPAVARLLSDPQPSVRREALNSLGEAKGLAIENLGAVLTAVKSEKDPEVRARAAEMVGQIADATFAIDIPVKAAAAEQALPVLTSAIETDTSPKVRENALKSLDKLQLSHEKVVPLLARAAVNGKDRDVRTMALRALRDRGRDAASAEGMIQPLTSDPEPWVSQGAKDAIQTMRSTTSSLSRKALTTAATTDPAARERALETLRDYHIEFTEEAYYLSLMNVEPEIVTAFLDAGMSPNHRFTSSSGEPPLRTLLRAGQGCDPSVRPTVAPTKTIMKLLLARGADANLADENGNTPLMAAVEKCDPDIVKALLAAKADINATNQGGSSAFEFGFWGSHDSAEALAAAGFRLSPEKVKIYREAYKDNPKLLALVKKATKSVPAKK